MISTCRARSTNFNVFIVSSMLLDDGEIFPTMKVSVLAVANLVVIGSVLINGTMG